MLTSGPGEFLGELNLLTGQMVYLTVALAMRHDVTATELRNSIYTHPSSTEALNEVFDKVVSTAE